MLGNETPRKAFDAILIDDRNERPLIIALAAIVVVWSLALGITFVSAHIPMPMPMRSTHLVDDGAPAVAALLAKR